LQISIALGGLIVTLSLITLTFYFYRKYRSAEIIAAQHRTALAHASRLMTVGEMTASIAHEINQPLSAILSNAEAAEILLQRPDPPLTKIRQILADIHKDNVRANNIIIQLRALLTKTELELASVSLNAVIEETLLLARGAVRKADAKLVCTLEENLPDIKADRTQLQQVLLNLLLNAIDAMEKTPRELREITVRTAQCGNRAECTVSDRGHGFNKEEKSKAFNSFFTTKKQGMGLGLSIAKTIIHRHNGAISIANREHGGAIVRILLSYLLIIFGNLQCREIQQFISQ